MRLYELTGYRDSEYTHKIKDGYAHFTKYLHSKGFNKLGSGCYASVYSHPGLDYVVKVFEEDSGYERFLRLCRDHRNIENFPKFRGKIIKIRNELNLNNIMINAVRMERLKPIDNDGETILRYLKNPYIPEYRRISRFNDRDTKIANRILKEQPRLNEAFEIVYNANAGNHVDLHNENIMMREDGTYVITDPYAD